MLHVGLWEHVHCGSAAGTRVLQGAQIVIMNMKLAIQLLLPGQAHLRTCVV